MKQNIFLFILSFFVLWGCDLNYSKHQMGGVPQFDDSYLESTLSTLNQDIHASPNNPDYQFKKAKILYQLNKIHSARLTLEKAMDLKKEDDPAFFILAAELSLQDEDFDATSKYIDKALHSGAQNPELNELQAMLALAKQDYTTAKEKIEQAILKDPYQAKYYHTQGKIHWKSGDTLSAISSYRQSFEVQPNKEISKDLLIAYSATAQYDSAFYFIDRLMAESPENIPLLLKKASLYTQVDKFDSAEVFYKKALQEDQQNPEIYHQIALLKQRDYRYDSAIYYENKALEFKDDYLSSYLSLARIYNRRGWFSQAIENYEQVLALDSGYQVARNELDGLYRKINYLNRLKREKERISNVRTIGPIKKESNPIVE